MEYLLRLILMLVVCVVSSDATLTRRCLAGSELFVCILPTFDYAPGQDIPVFDLPADIKAIRFIDPFSDIHGSDNEIQMYDRVLHRQLNSPPAIELRSTYMKVVEIPPNLEYGDFSNNAVAEVLVPSNQSYALRYLDLINNGRLIIPEALDNISRLVNLETLHLSNCAIETLPPNMFENLNRLAHLTLAGNGLKKINLEHFPMSLTLLRLDVNSIEELVVSGSTRLPLLEDLNLEYNGLQELNVAALVNTAPKLRLFSIGRNPLKQPVLNAILDELNRRNIAYFNMEVSNDAQCADHEVYYRGVCMKDDFFLMKWTDWLELVVLFLGLVALVGGIAYGGTVLWKRYFAARFSLPSSSSSSHS
uniref:Leucine rich immune protein (Coil-less) n=1 Tax=Anopheles christyi TaxID=43041 RepID=A0A182JZ24_9DIPT